MGRFRLLVLAGFAVEEEDLAAEVAVGVVLADEALPFELEGAVFFRDAVGLSRFAPADAGAPPFIIAVGVCCEEDDDAG